MNNFKRKIILETIDKNINVDNCTLGMYDLTAYFSKDNLDSSLAEKILFTKNEQRHISHIPDSELYFMPNQQLALNYLKSNDKVLLSAPTSFGKTLIVKEYIYSEQPTSIIYIVPTNSLSYELELSFKQNNYFSNYEIFDRSKDTNLTLSQNQKFIFIGTQEKYLEVKDIFPDKISLFVIDEAYKLQERTSLERGYKLSKTFLESINNSSDKVFLLSPNGSFIGFDDYGFREFNTYFNAVDRNYHLVTKGSFYSELINKSYSHKTILFCASPAKISESLNCFNEYYTDSAVNIDFVNFLKSEFHEDWSVIKFLEKGILTHHGLMPKFLQNKLISLFNSSKEYKLLIGTNSISEGINTPTKNIFIHPDYNDITNNLLLIKNTIGRAGRLGQYPIGHIYSIAPIFEEINKDVEIILSISNEEELTELEASKDESKIQSLCDDFSITFDFYNELYSKYKISISKIRRIFEVLMDNIDNDSFWNLTDMAHKVFYEEYPVWESYIDKNYLNGVLNYYYLDGKNKIRLNNYKAKIDFFNAKSKTKYSNSKIMEGYMKMIYSTLEYKICPIMNVGYDILVNIPNWNFGDGVEILINKFIKRYYDIFYGTTNIEKYNEEEKNVLITLKEYGLSINDKLINQQMITEIVEYLNIRYSTYDVINSIKYLSINSKRNTDKFKYLVERYM